MASPKFEENIVIDGFLFRDLTKKVRPINCTRVLKILQLSNGVKRGTFNCVLTPG